MKKKSLIIISIFTIGFISSCTKDNNIKTAAVSNQTDVSGDRADMGSGD